MFSGKTVVTVVFILVTCCGIGIIFGNEFEKVKTIQVTNYLYMIKNDAGFVGNVSFFVTNKGVVVVDSGDCPEYGHLIVKEIKKITDKPVKYLILTHYHADHTSGVSGFPAGVIVIGHHNIIKNLKMLRELLLETYSNRIGNTRKKIERLKKENNPDVEKEETRLKANIEKYQSLKNTPVRFPGLTFAEKITLHPGKNIAPTFILEVVYPGNTHTSDGCIVYFPGLKAVHLADMILDGIHPLIYERDHANTQNWAAFLKELLSWDIEIVIPGHGEAGTKKIIEKQLQYLSRLRLEVQNSINEGLTLEQIRKRVILPEYKDYLWPGVLQITVETIYNELKQDSK